MKKTTIFNTSRSAVKSFMALALGAFMFSSCDQVRDHIDDIGKDVDKNKEKMFVAHLTPLNNSGVTGTAYINYSENGKFQVLVNAEGLAPNRVHPQHIHGFVPDGDMANQNAVCPPPSAAGDDGLLTLVDGLPFYGPVLIPLDDDLVPLSVDNFPMANKAGNLSYVEYVATDKLMAAFDAMYEGTQTEADLKLLNRVIVLHGAFVVDGKVQMRYSNDAEYIATLPVACGEIMKKH